MLDERFWSKVNKDTDSGCWEWTANKNNKGYGMFSVSSYVGKQLAHRLSYKDAHGPIPKGGLILHSCDNQACVNPEHLRVGTYKENVADMDTRKRRVTNTPFGEDNCNALLTAEKVIQMRRDYLAGVKNAVLAERYGMTELSIKDVTLGRSWKHLLGVNGAPSLAELKAYAKVSQKSASKITQEVAFEIRRRLNNGELGKDLAAEFGIHKATVSDIKKGKTWPG